MFVGEFFGRSLRTSSLIFSKILLETEHRASQVRQKCDFSVPGGLPDSGLSKSTFCFRLRNASLNSVIGTHQSSSIRFRGKQLLFTNLNFLPVIIGLETSTWVFFTIRLVNFFEISTETSWFTMRLPAYCLISGNSVKFTQIFLKS